MIEHIGKYRVVRQLGKGATAIVYLAQDPDDGREVAIKLVRFAGENQALSRRLRKLFAIEHAVARRLDHPNIVRIFDAEVEAEQAWIVMEYVSGTPLDKWIAIDNLLPQHRVIGIIFKCCMALDYAARQGVVHRDIKPANILIDAEDNPKITDFGLALNLHKDINQDSTFIMGAGSPAYMSPEQIKNYPLNHKTDLYSLGVLLFQMLTGRLPFRANNAATLVYRIINMDAPSICALNPHLPEGLDAIIKKALEKDLYNRYRSGADFAKDLAAVRYQIVRENDPAEDRAHFDRLRGLPFFTEFDNVELWETLRICVWREVAPKVTIMREGEAGRTFSIIINGFVELSIDGRILSRLEPGEVVGEWEYLHPEATGRRATAVTLEPTLLLEVNASALSLSSEELQERFQKLLMKRVLDRLASVSGVIAKNGMPAVKGSGAMAKYDLELAPE